MPREPSQRRWPRLAGVVVGLALLIAYVAVMRPALERRRVRRTIARYKTDPSRETAQALADLLDRQQVPQALGNEILALLVTPDVAVRAAYPAGERPHIAASYPCCFHFLHMVLHRRRFKWALGEEQGGSAGGCNSINPGPQLRAMGVPKAPGTYPAALDYKIALIPEESYSSGQSWERQRAAAAYHCEFKVPIQIRIVEPEHAEKIERRMGQELDKALKAAFRPSKHSMTSSCSLEGGASYEVTGQFAFEVGPLPESVGFRFTYRDQGGLTMEVKDETFRARAGSLRGTAAFPVTALRLPPGRYEGTVILEADEATAYPDAAIKTIWGGTIELPISFIVRVTEQVPEERSEDAK